MGTLKAATPAIGRGVDNGRKLALRAGSGAAKTQKCKNTYWFAFAHFGLGFAENGNSENPR